MRYPTPARELELIIRLVKDDGKVPAAARETDPTQNSLGLVVVGVLPEDQVELVVLDALDVWSTAALAVRP
jgi:hypothetical protein